MGYCKPIGFLYGLVSLGLLLSGYVHEWSTSKPMPPAHCRMANAKIAVSLYRHCIRPRSSITLWFLGIQAQGLQYVRRLSIPHDTRRLWIHCFSVVLFPHASFVGNQTRTRKRVGLCREYNRSGRKSKDRLCDWMEGTTYHQVLHSERMTHGKVEVVLQVSEALHLTVVYELHILVTPKNWLGEKLLIEVRPDEQPRSLLLIIVSISRIILCNTLIAVFRRYWVTEPGQS